MNMAFSSENQERERTRKIATGVCAIRMAGKRPYRALQTPVHARTPMLAPYIKEKPTGVLACRLMLFALSRSFRTLSIGSANPIYIIAHARVQVKRDVQKPGICVK